MSLFCFTEPFFPFIGIQTHARTRRKTPNSSVDQLFDAIMNGDVSDADLSDDEVADVQAAQAVTASNEEHDPKMHPADDEGDLSDSDEMPAKKVKHVKWLSKPFDPVDTRCTYHPLGGSTPEEPLKYFMKYFTDEVFEDFTKYTNIYALQNTGNELSCSVQEMKVFFGILIYMGVLKFPRVRMYWQSGTRISAIADAMAVNRFFKLRSALHITDQNEPRDASSVDKFWKVRPLLDVIRSRCLQLEELEHNCIDEQMVAFTGRVPAKQVVKSKPNPVGVKIFVRCSTDGLAHDFELYQGKGTGVDREFSYLGLGGCVVMRLVESFPQHRNLKLFFDNYFTSVLLLRELKGIGILATGTIRCNRLLGCKLKGEKEMRKEERGSTDVKVTEEGDVALVRWKDNNLVTVASTQVSTGEARAVSRWSSSKKERIEVECPQAILEYNRHMGGVDKLDFIMSFYHIRAKTKKWPVRVISHLTSFALANSWLQYLRDASAEGLVRKNTMDMLQFQTDTAMSLLVSEKPLEKKRGRPSAESLQRVSKAPHNSGPLLTNTVRLDGKAHWPQHVDARFPQRCRKPGCNSKSRVRCRKCEVFLCLSATNDCFYEYHTK
ncbi:piggyBac transposable element-derived protein 3-like isoform X1 [Dermacentor andersoni]|uniref:piggyBac transposable element-derived protein 3-like isoform X1 n=1 Tax=Dermacentor andersoni TaxID=34620 RepID=UPI003B3A3EF0